ncbi:uncharacterized protein ATNIH1004_007765 [Aspergillus tanneri]|uniref:Major facilitator superfamily (MFS) profile domain-containing protein n=1 Tax=Aspergillus tanneri TaxID=1220188 RepID=A0A5M9MH83_9EURO|nr:uncharacterized protein ATNIH1004_007765 [Aspergillus tanneri]KAA8646338.1 hypothetical protein ATNIH1004_007765 [Aspergillus tanneri]
MVINQAPEPGKGVQQDTCKHATSEIILIPQPTEDPSDPLNWSMSKKIIILALVSISAFIGIAQALANQSGFFAQAELYNKNPIQISYSISAAIAGLATGPFIWTLLSKSVGRSSCIFWGLLGTLGCGIWSATMTGTNDYISFVISRWLAGTFGSAPSTLGAGTVLDMFFLHQRGKAFACYTLCTLFGTQIGATLSGFIVEYAPWPVQFWWTVGLEGLMAILVFLFLEETGFSREGNARTYAEPPHSWLRNRVATFFPGNPVSPQERAGGKHNLLALCLVAISPVTLLAGTFLLLTFGWAVAVATLLSVFLQTPKEEGGYGFSPLQVSCFTFTNWVALFAAQVYGILLNDRIPIWFCRRFRRGMWEPEIRLFPVLLVPMVLLPVSLGLFGAGLQYHLHFMVLALAVFLGGFCENILIPVTINYVVECFTDYAEEVAAILNFFRLSLGLTVPFFIKHWEEAVGLGWVFGMMAFLALFAFSLMGLLAWKGALIRQYSVAHLRKSEDGMRLIAQREVMAI